jgi:dTDP-4-dehydrorhamnose reductase
MRPILVFGGEGQLGRELQRQSSQADVPLISVGHMEADIADMTVVARFISRASCSFVVNAAAYTKVDGAEREPDEAFRANATGPGILARACAHANLPLVHISTDYVFDGSKTAAYSEHDTISPLGVYGRSKAAGETSIRDMLEQHLILRTSWVYGPYGANFLKTVIQLAGAPPIQSLTPRVSLRFSVFAPRIGMSEPAKLFQLC